MIRRPPRSTRTDTLFPYTTLFRSRRRSKDTDPVVSVEQSTFPREFRLSVPANIGDYVLNTDGRQPHRGRDIAAPAKTTGTHHTSGNGVPPPNCRNGRNLVKTSFGTPRSEENTSARQSLMRIWSSVFSLKKH